MKSLDSLGQVVEGGSGWIMDDGGGALSIYGVEVVPPVEEETMDNELSTAGVIVERNPFPLIYNEEKSKSEDNRIVHVLPEAV
jgi:hypothetical protein